MYWNAKSSITNTQHFCSCNIAVFIPSFNPFSLFSTVFKTVFVPVPPFCLFFITSGAQLPCVSLHHPKMMPLIICPEIMWLSVCVYVCVLRVCHCLHLNASLCVYAWMLDCALRLVAMLLDDKIREGEPACMGSLVIKLLTYCCSVYPKKTNTIITNKQYPHLSYYTSKNNFFM